MQRLSFYEMESATRIQIQDKAAFISLRANTQGEA